MIDESKDSDTANENLAIFKSVHDDFLRFIGRLKFKEDADPHGLIRVYTSALIEHAGSLIYLFDGEKSAGIRSLFRSYFECYVQLTNLLLHNSYAEDVMYEYHVHESEIIKSLLKTENGLDEDRSVLTEKMQQHRAERDRLKGIGAKKLSKRQKIDKAGWKSIYDTIYSSLSDGSHLGLHTVWNSHYDVDRHEFVLYEEFILARFSTLLMVGHSLLAGAMIHLAEKMNLQEDPLIQGIENRYSVFRGKLA